MEGLTAVSTTYTKSRVEVASHGAAPDSTGSLKITTGPITTPERAIEALKSEPDYPTLVRVLEYLSGSKQNQNHQVAFSIANPSPESAQIIQALVNEIAPNYWILLTEGAATSAGDFIFKKGSDASLFLASLRSIAGINAVVVRLRALIQEAKSDQGGPRRPDLALNAKILLAVLCGLLDQNAPKNMYDEVAALVQSVPKRRPVIQEMISVLGGGRIVSVSAEAQALCQEDDARFWVSDGQAYSRWLARSTADWARCSTSEDDLKVCAELFSRSMSLGYPRKKRWLFTN
jgi:telomere length regulation protein